MNTATRPARRSIHKAAKAQTSTLTPAEQAEKAAREAAWDAAVAAAAARANQLLARARSMCASLAPAMGAVYIDGLDEGSSSYSNGFISVGFGASADRAGGFAGAAHVELRIDIDTRGSFLDCGRLLRGAISELPPPVLSIDPRACSLDSRAGLDAAAALGTALVQAAAFGRALLASLSV